MTEKTTTIAWVTQPSSKGTPLEQRLNEAGIEVDWIDNADDALDAFANREYPLILVDLHLAPSSATRTPALRNTNPRDYWKNGKYVLEMIRGEGSKNRGSRVIAIGHHDRHTDRYCSNPSQVALTAGANTYIDRLTTDTYGVIDTIIREVATLQPTP